MLIRGAEVEGRLADVRIEGELVAELAPRLGRRTGEVEIDAGGGALLPGLHDHHIHLFALAARESSVPVGPDDVADVEALSRLLRSAAPFDGWIRAVGYHESVAGLLDRNVLDRIRPDVPVRIQHATGILWMVNSRGVERLGLDEGVSHPGVERDPNGRATGRLVRADGLLRERLGSRPPSLARVGERLASHGVTGVTDATATNGPDELRIFRTAVDRGELPQRIHVMGSAELPSTDGRVTRGALKVVLDEATLPDLDEIIVSVRSAHAEGRTVAVHCVTRTELVFACRAFEEAGTIEGDRLEHASVAPPEVLPTVSRLDLTVVTQPGFVKERGDRYLRDVEPSDQQGLYRLKAWLSAGVPVGGSTDAPFGDPDPWQAMRAAVERRTASGAMLGAAESVTPEVALGLFTSPPDDPGGPGRRVATGRIADLCLLHRPWKEARAALEGRSVRMTFVSGSPLGALE